MITYVPIFVSYERSRCSDLTIANRTSANYFVPADNRSCAMEANNISEIPQTCLISKTQRIAIYVPLMVCGALLNFVRVVAFYLVSINASRVLHNRMFSTILRIPVLFFDTNPSGKCYFRYTLI